MNAPKAYGDNTHLTATAPSAMSIPIIQGNWCKQRPTSYVLISSIVSSAHSWADCVEEKVQPLQKALHACLQVNLCDRRR